MVTELSVGRGEPLPLGLRQTSNGFNFAVFSRNAHRVSLLFFNDIDKEPVQTILLDPVANRTGDIWHVHFSGDARGKNNVLKVDAGPWSKRLPRAFLAPSP